MTQASQIIESNLVGHVQTQPPTNASAMSPPLGMFQDFIEGRHPRGDGNLDRKFPGHESIRVGCDRSKQPHDA
jgi:hypothetical protein